MKVFLDEFFCNLDESVPNRYALVTSVPSSVEFTRVLFLDTASFVFLSCGDCVSCARSQVL